MFPSITNRPQAQPRFAARFHSDAETDQVIQRLQGRHGGEPAEVLANAIVLYKKVSDSVVMQRKPAVITPENRPLQEFYEKNGSLPHAHLTGSAFKLQA